MTTELKNRLSKVMNLGNKLAPRMGRHDAFVRAWVIVKAGGLTLPVKGVTFGTRQEALKRLAAYTDDGEDWEAGLGKAALFRALSLARSDALELLDELIRETGCRHRKDYFLSCGLKALRDAMEREIL
jgi:hypothetical protein